MNNMYFSAFYFNEQLKFHAQLSLARKKLYNLEAVVGYPSYIRQDSHMALDLSPEFCLAFIYLY